MLVKLGGNMALKCLSALAKHSPVRCILVALSLLIADSVCFAEKIPEDKLTAEHIAKEVKSTAESLAKSNSLAIKKPIFEFDDKTKELQYYIGNVRVELIGL